jgi:hypothetical protein
MNKAYLIGLVVSFAFAMTIALGGIVGGKIANRAVAPKSSIGNTMSALAQPGKVIRIVAASPYEN